MLWLINWMRWRRSHKRVRQMAERLMQHNGEHAFFRSHERAWAAQGLGNRWEAKFWESVCREISRRIQRDQILRRFSAEGE